VSDRLADAHRRASDLLAAAVARDEVPGAAWCVALADGTRHVSVVGVADVETQRPVEPTTAFCLASSTKPIAGLALGALLDDGAVTLDQPVALPSGLVHELGAVRAPTLREIANHTAGLGPHHRFFYDDDGVAVTVDDAVASLATPVWAPGERWSYSNLGYGVLERELAAAAGTSLAELVEQRVFRPLGLDTAAWGGATGPDGAAVRYGAGARRYPGYVTDHPAASEAWCSVEDLARIGLAQLQKSLLRPATHDLLVTPSAPRQPDGAAYGLGWVTRHVGSRGDDLWVHAGRMGGVGAHLTVLPCEGLVLAAVANAETDVLGQAVALVLADVLPGYEPPAPVPGWEAGRPEPSMALRWRGSALLAGELIDVELDAASDRMTLTARGVVAPLVAPHVRAERIAAHVALGRPFASAPDDALVHLDLRPHGDGFAGAMTFAQYPNERRWRQGDAVSAAIVLERAG
jgi:CubicO group peptidase (beta-lactamase class C family)